MERKKHYQNPKMQENLYQYEMGIDLGAEIEMEKRRHQAEFEREHQNKDYKGTSGSCLIIAKTDADLKKEA